MSSFKIDPRRLASAIVGLDSLRDELQGHVDDTTVETLTRATALLYQAHADLEKFYYEVPTGYNPPKGTCGGKTPK